MSVNNFVWDEMKFFVSCLRSLPVSETLKLNDEAVCVFTNTPYENWVYYPNPEGDDESVSRSFEFFKERNVSFMWPVYNAESLRHTELIHAGDLTAMYLESNHEAKYESNPSVTFKRIDSHSDAQLWANTAWRSFVADDDVPDTFREFTDALIDSHEHLALTAAMYEGEAAGAYITTIMGGVYYFGVLPEMRRRGIARAMMNEICRQNKRITLQATRIGYAFYKSYGFTELFKMPVYSNDPDIF